MTKKRFNIVEFIRSMGFSLIVHIAIVAVLAIGVWWPFSNPKPIGGTPIQATAVDLTAIEQAKAQRIQEEQERVAAIEEAKRKAEQEELEKQQREQEAIELEKKQEQQRIEEEKRAQAEQERKLEEAKQQKIAQEKKRQEEAEQKKREQEEQKRKAQQEEKAREAAEQARREKALQEKIASEQAAAKRQQLAGEAQNALSEYVGRIQRQIEQNWIRPADVRSGLQAVIEVQVAPGGKVLSARVIQSSGNARFDRSAEVAVLKSSPLPFPENPKFYEFIRKFSIRFNPN